MTLNRLLYNLKFNFHRHVFALTLVSVVTLLTSCSDNSHSPEPPTSSEPANRTVLVYMLSSGNGLGENYPYNYDIQDLEEMLEAAEGGALNGGRLVVFHSSSDGNQILKEVTSAGIDTLKIYDKNLSPQTVERMTQVFDDLKSLAEANNYGLVLWGHGSGWLQDGIAESFDDDIQPLGYGWEHELTNNMKITSLAKALEGRDFDFLYMDCCYMASVEVAYQLRHAVKTIVAYSTEVLGWGMPYQSNVECFFADEPDLIQAAKNTFDFYDAQVNPRYRMCTVAVIDTQSLDLLADATRAIYSSNKVGFPAAEQQPFETGSKSNYHDFGVYVRSLSAAPEQFLAFESALSDVVIYQQATERIWNTLKINSYSGLSTYIMTGGASALYKNYCELDWYKDVASSLAVN